MGLNISKGDMYAFVSHTFNAVKGKCSHDCSYCFMKQYGEQKPVRLDKTEFKTDLGKGNFIFVGSSCDMWADDIPKGWILDILGYCADFNNKYLFQSKNPDRFLQFVNYFPDRSILGTTIETNRIWPEMGKAPTPQARAKALQELRKSFTTMITVEPIMEFSPLLLWELICSCQPEWMTIGADSKNHDLPEPSAVKIGALISSVKEQGIEVVIKKNLARLMGTTKK